MADYYPLEIAPSGYKTISGVCRQYNVIIRDTGTMSAEMCLSMLEIIE